MEVPYWLGYLPLLGEPTLVRGLPTFVRGYLPWPGRYLTWLEYLPLLGVPTLARGLPTFVRGYLPWLGRYLPWPGGTYPGLSRYLPFLRGIYTGHGDTFLSGGSTYPDWGYLPQLRVLTFTWVGYLPWSGRCTFLDDLRKYFSLGGCGGPERIFLFWEGMLGLSSVKISQVVKKMPSCQKDVKCQNVKHLDYGEGSQKK